MKTNAPKEDGMNRTDFFESTTEPTESLADERALYSEAMFGTTTLCVVEAPADRSDAPTETEWSAFMGLPWNTKEPRLH
jgi:hypothetical protein